MKLLRNRPKQDPAKAATYNPKEFRGRRTGAFVVPPSETPPSSPRRWLSFFLLIALIVGAFYLWKGYTPVGSLSVPMPVTGEVKRVRQESPGTVYTSLKLIGNKEGRHSMVSLEDWQTGALVLTVFVRSGEVAELAVPLGQYRMKVASGLIWYGSSKRFGPVVAVDQLVTPVNFSRNAAGGTTGMMIELTQRPGGNLQSTSSNF